MIISKSQAIEQILFRYTSQLVECRDRAWRDWVNEAYRMQNARFRAVYIHNALLHNARQVFAGVDGVVVTRLKARCGQWDGLLFGADTFVRFKKADERLLSRNYQTLTALDFHDQSVDLFGGVSRLELVYTLKPYGVGIDRYVLLQRSGDSIVWQADVEDGMAGEQGVIPFAQPSAPAGSPADRILKPKHINYESDVRKEGGGPT